VVLINHHYFADQHHPVRSIEVASRYFIDVAATPPRLRRGVSHKFKLRHYRTDRSLTPFFDGTIDIESIDTRTIFRSSGDRCRRKDQSTPETHLYTKYPAIDGRSISKPEDDAFAIIRAKPFGEAITARLTGVVDQDRGRPFRRGEDFNHLDFNPNGPLLSNPA
jgi:hypothetical protein